MTLFIAGIHGVGKTYLAQPAAMRLGMHYATASQLIREERGLSSWNANKLVDSVAENQAALISAVRRIKNEDRSLLLDGHFVLRTAVGAHERLPEAHTLIVHSSSKDGPCLNKQARQAFALENFRS